MSAEVALRAHHLSKRFELQQERRYTFKERMVRGKPKGTREFWALRDVSFEVPKGSFYGIIGHNGSGKSTALKVLAGIYRPTSGHVAVDGRLRALLELGAGFHPELTGRENIQLNASILGLSQREIRASMDEIIEFAGIDEFIDSPVKVYSSGMAVRLGFAVAVKMDPEILIVDEVIAVGDEQFQRQCHDYMFDLRRRGVTIVLVSHAMGVVEEMCDEVVWLDHGSVSAQGPATEVVRGYLQQVNRSEAAKKTAAAAQGSLPGVPADETRRGSGEVRVTAVEVVDAAGQPLPLLTPDVPCRFRIRYEASEPVDGFDVSLGFYTEQGVCIAFTETRVHGRTQATAAGPGYLDYELPAMPLRAGSYLLSVVVAREGHFYDLADKEFPLSVRSDSSQPPGLVALSGQWGDVVQHAPQPAGSSSE